MLVLKLTSYTLSCTKAIHVHGTCGILDNAHHGELKQVQNERHLKWQTLGAAVHVIVLVC